MTAPYTVDVVVAGLAWSVDGPAGPVDPLAPPELGPIAPLTIRDALPDDALWPSQPQPETATFAIAAAAWSDVDQVVRGADCHLTFTAAGNPDTITFDGNVSDVQVVPTRIKVPGTGLVDGVVVAVIAVGYLAQLWEEAIVVDETDWVGSWQRLQNLFDATPWPMPRLIGSSGFPPDFGELGVDTPHAPLEADGDALGPHLDKLLTSWLGWLLAGDPDRIVRPIVVPNLTAGRTLDPVLPWRFEYVDNTIPIVPVADFIETPAGWGVGFDPAGVTLDDPLISAGRLDRAIAFTQQKARNVSRVVVKYLDRSGAKDKVRSVSASNGEAPAVRKEIETDLDLGSDPEWAQAVADFYLPAAGADLWGVEAVVWRLYADVPGRMPPALGTLVTFAPVPESVNPNGRGWITGLIAARQLTISGGRPVVELTLQTAKGRGVASGDRLTWADLPAGVSWNELKADTWEDYDLLKGP